MTPQAMAALHTRAFTMPRPWTAAEFSGFLQDPAVVTVSRDTGFALGRVVLDEAELLTIAVDPDARRRGSGTMLMGDFIAACAARDVTRIFLEVAATNAPARALYDRFGFSCTGRRTGYYREPDGKTVDAVTMSINL